MGGSTTTEEIEKEKQKVDRMTRYEMAELWRFAPSGHPYFDRSPLADYFQERFKLLGGFSPEISKALG